MTLQLTLFIILGITSLSISSPRYPAFYMFGDSWSDDNGVLGTWKTWHVPSTPPCDRRWSNGPTWPYYLARSLGLECQWNLSETNSGINNCSMYMNFATGSACAYQWNSIDPNIVPYCSLTYNNSNTLPSNYSYTFNDQIDRWSQMNIDPSIIKNALFGVFIGGNDMNGILQFQGNLITKIEDVLYKDDDVVSAIVQGIDDLYGYGARNFLFLNFPSILVTPRGLAATTNVLFKTVADQFIGSYLEKLQNHIDDQFGYSDANFIYGNIYGCMRQLAVGKYGGWNGNGFNLTTTQCVANRDDPNSAICSDPSAAVFWDDVHPTTSFHRFLANLTLDLINGDTSGCFSTTCIEEDLFSSCFESSSTSLKLPFLWVILGTFLLAILL